jgi:hypothetical protein
MSCLYHIRYYTSHFVTFFSDCREGKRQEAKGRRQKAGGKRQEAGGKRQKAKGRRQEAKGRRQKAGGKRQEAGDYFYLFSPCNAHKVVSPLP